MDVLYFADPMKRLFNFLQINKYFVLFIFFISYLLVIKSRISAGRNIETIFQPDGPLATFFQAFFIMVLIKITINYLSKKQSGQPLRPIIYLKHFVASFILYLVISNLSGFTIALIFDTVERNFNPQTLILSNFTSSIDFILFGSLYLAYLYWTENNNNKKKVAELDKAVGTSTIQQLKAQLNPHFLFNNLNTLDQLIEEDQEKASDFLNDFAELYRYSLITSEKKLIPIREEIQFIKSYFKLMQHKYNGYYHLSIEDENHTSHCKVPPFCLQVLVENAIEHNMGSVDNPVHIEMKISEDITVINNKVPGKRKKISSGRALKNLDKQFEILAHKNIVIEENEKEFKVILPIITDEKND